LKTLSRLIVNILVGCMISTSVFAQTFWVEVQVNNQPAGTVIFGSVKGDNFTPIDSTILTKPGGKLKFSFPENAHSGVYRIVLGQTPYAKVMNEGPQLFDFIFDNENLIFETDFKEPVDKLVVMQSKENKVWFDFLKEDKLLTENIVLLEKEIDQLWQKRDTLKVLAVANDYNALQMDRDVKLMKTINDNKGLFASQMIKNKRHPLLDGYLTQPERNQLFKKEFFKVLDFTNPNLINSSLYTDNVFIYLMSYNMPGLTQKQRETEYIKAVDSIVPNVKQNQEVYQFVLDYLVHGFTVLKMDGVLNYISKKYNYPK